MSFVLIEESRFSQKDNWFSELLLVRASSKLVLAVLFLLNGILNSRCVDCDALYLAFLTGPNRLLRCSECVLERP